jgi:hypothetical protein
MMMMMIMMMMMMMIGILQSGGQQSGGQQSGGLQSGGLHTTRFGSCDALTCSLEAIYRTLKRERCLGNQCIVAHSLSLSDSVLSDSLFSAGRANAIFLISSTVRCGMPSCPLAANEFVSAVQRLHCSSELIYLCLHDLCFQKF